MASQKLSPMQDRFIRNLIKGMTQEKAYIKAGYKAKHSAVCASQLLTNPKIIKELAKRKARAAKLAEVSRAKILKEYARIAFVDIRKFFEPDGTLKAIIDLDDDTAAALGGMDIQEGLPEIVTKKFKLIDKRGALDSLSKIEGLFEKDNEQKSKKENEVSQACLDMFNKAMK